MKIVKSFSVKTPKESGDMFYIKHGNDNFTVIDCCLEDERQDDIITEIQNESKDKNIYRFISTHPDEDHIYGLKTLNKEWEISNFYCVKNEATKEEPSESFNEYCSLRDDTDKAYYIYKDCKRKWLNQDGPNKNGDDNYSAGISILWPDTSNSSFKKALADAKEGKSPNNISPIIRYGCEAKFMWMGDLETSYLEDIKGSINFTKVDVLFAAHHGRDSGTIPKDILEKLSPKIIVIGEAPSKDLNYYPSYNTITQNTAKDITFVVNDTTVDIYVSNENYSKNDFDFLENLNKNDFDYYLGSFTI